MNQEIINKAAKIIGENTAHSIIQESIKYCTLALIDLNGYPTVSTISPSKSDGINWITFCTGLGSNKTKRIEKCNRAGICFCNDNYNITLVGTIDIITDSTIKNEMWYEGLENHFSGPDDPNYCVLMFKTERYNLFIDWKEVEGNV